MLDAGRWRPIFAELFPITAVAALSNDFKFPGTAEVLATGHEMGAKSVLVTDGPNPVVFSNKAGQNWVEKNEIPVPKVPTVDTLGAGDFFHGALIVALVRGLPLAEAIQFATEIASMRVQHIGTRTWLSKLK
ncbi:MAG: PfkB family carbohydrate kinase [Cellulomonadaceae bacterium]|nr:PfkB family carbohydrate kinase [Cellulomonadaceae bacterium]